jgi:hypothetical protein
MPAEERQGARRRAYMDVLGRMVEPGATLAVLLREDRDQNLGIWPRPDVPRRPAKRELDLNARVKFLRVHANPDAVQDAQDAHQAITGLTYDQFDEVFEVVRNPLMAEPRTYDAESRLFITCLWLRSNAPFRVLEREMRQVGIELDSKALQRLCSRTVTLIDYPLCQRYIVGGPLLRRQHALIPPMDGAPVRRGERKIDYVPVACFNHPEVVAAVDCTSVHIWQPRGDTSYWDAKNKIPALKILLAVSPDGLAVFVYIHELHTRGAQHDKTIFLRSGLLDLVKLPGGEHAPMSFDRAWTGVQTLNGYPEAVVLLRATRGHPLTEAQRAFNDSVECERVVVENYFGRLKGVWKILRETYRGGIALLPAIARTCVALTNLLLHDAPLRPSSLRELPDDSDQESD